MCPDTYNTVQHQQHQPETNQAWATAAAWLAVRAAAFMFSWPRQKAKQAQEVYDTPNSPRTSPKPSKIPATAPNPGLGETLCLSLLGEKERPPFHRPHSEPSTKLQRLESEFLACKESHCTPAGRVIILQCVARASLMLARGANLPNPKAGEQGAQNSAN